MAQSKKKKTNKKTSAKPKKNTQKKQTGWWDSDLGHVCLFLSLVAITIISVLQYGVVGSVLHRFFTMLLGNIAPLFLVAATALAGYRIVDDEPIETRYVLGVISFSMAWVLFQSIRDFMPQTGFYGLKDISSNALSLLQGTYRTSGGMIGAFFLGIFTSLFDYAGCYVIIALLVILGVVLVGYNYIVDIVNDVSEESEVRKKERVVIREQRKVARQQDRAQRFQQAKQKESIFLDYQQEDVQKESVFVDLEDVVKKKPKKKKEEPVFVEEIEPEPIEVEETPIQQEEIEEVQHFIVGGEEQFADYQVPTNKDIQKMLERPVRQNRSKANNANIAEMGNKLITVLKQFGVDAKMVGYTIGPSVTKFEIKPAMGVRVSKISSLQNDIKMALAATDIRIEAPIPGKNAVGIEIPNSEKTSVQMSELVYSVPDSKQNSKLLFSLGKDLNGDCVYGEMNKMPHLLIAGATGSGKSVCVNSIICSILLRAKPDEVKLILVDPKKVEFTPYNDVPHLLAPVITDSDMANKALKVVVQMMDKRYDLFSELGVRNITAYNQYLAEHQGEETKHLKPLPWLVVIIDELADLMLVAAKEVESSIQRITQLARAAGIHLIVATQRPSVDVITGVIKANIPSRIAFAVSSAVDSRTILDQVGAEKLLGYGDMLYLPNGETAPRRIQGVFIKDDEVNRITEFVKGQKDKEGNPIRPRYDDTFITLKDIASQGKEVGECADPLYQDVKSFVIQSRKASTSLIQRKFSIGYSRAARLIDVLEENGIIGPANGSKPREILVQNTLEDGPDSI